MRRLIILLMTGSFILSGCANLGRLAGMAAAGYGIYRAVKNK